VAVGVVWACTAVVALSSIPAASTAKRGKEVERGMSNRLGKRKATQPN
jgi:hypothetical protein